MTVLLDKLPYKRIPTDRDRYQAPGINSEAPVVLDFQVEQPKNTAYSLKGVSVYNQIRSKRPVSNGALTL